MYDLLKQLKEAGFPQKNPNRCEHWEELQIQPQSTLEIFKHEQTCNLVYEPTTDELIEELGNDFHCLVYTTTGGMDSDKKFYSAGKTALVKDWVTGSTPKEALIRLYIALHKE